MAPGWHRAGGAVLYDPRMSAPERRPPGPEWVRAWKPVVAGVREVLHARFLDHAYPPHVHDAWTLFIVDDGWISYDLEASHRGRAASGSRSCRRASSTTGARPAAAGSASGCCTWTPACWTSG
jgi:hypothetical protein